MPTKILFLSLLALLFTVCTKSDNTSSDISIIDQSLIKKSLKSGNDLKIGMESYTENIPLLFAAQNSDNTNESEPPEDNLNLKLTEADSDKLFAELYKGELDIIIVPFYEFIKYEQLKNKPKLTIFLLTAYSSGYHKLLTNGNFTNAKQLKGRKIAIVENGIVNISAVPKYPNYFMKPFSEQLLSPCR